MTDELTGAPGMGAERLVLVSERLGAITDIERRVEASGAIVRTAPLWSLEQIAANGADAAIIILGAVEPFDAAAMDALPSLLAVVRRGVGVDNVDVEAATERGIVVANVPDASVEEVSDHALAMLVAIERGIPALDRAVHDGRWQHDPSQMEAIRAPSRRLSTLTLGIVGLGRIGQALLRKARPLYGQILASDPVVSAPEASALGAVLVEADQLLAESDHVSLHAPLLPETHHLINDRSLGLLRADAVLVNTSRGGLIDEAALVAAVRGNRLRAAGLDVTEHEPLAADDPLLTVPSVILTAHSAASSQTTKVELSGRSVDAAIALLSGHLPDSVVNPDVLTSPRLRHHALRA